MTRKGIDKGELRVIMRCYAFNSQLEEYVRNRIQKRRLQGREEKMSWDEGKVEEEVWVTRDVGQCRARHSSIVLPLLYLWWAAAWWQTLPDISRPHSQRKAWLTQSRSEWVSDRYNSSRRGLEWSYWMQFLTLCAMMWWVQIIKTRHGGV